MIETRILIRLLRIYFPQILEFGSASEFRGRGGLNPQTPPSVRHWVECIYVANGTCFTSKSSVSGPGSKGTFHPGPLKDSKVKPHNVSCWFVIQVQFEIHGQPNIKTRNLYFGSC
jgi:hypothetical protein